MMHAGSECMPPDVKAQQTGLFLLWQWNRSKGKGTPGGDAYCFIEDSAEGASQFAIHSSQIRGQLQAVHPLQGTINKCQCITNKRGLQMQSVL